MSVLALEPPVSVECGCLCPMAPAKGYISPRAWKVLFAETRKWRTSLPSRLRIHVMCISARTSDEFPEIRMYLNSDHRWRHIVVSNRDELAKTFRPAISTVNPNALHFLSLPFFLNTVLSLSLSHFLSLFHPCIPLSFILFFFSLLNIFALFISLLYEITDCHWYLFHFFFLINSRLPSSQTHNSYHNLKSYNTNTLLFFFCLFVCKYINIFNHKYFIYIYLYFYIYIYIYILY